MLCDISFLGSFTDFSALGAVVVVLVGSTISRGRLLVKVRRVVQFCKVLPLRCFPVCHLTVDEGVRRAVKDELGHRIRISAARRSSIELYYH